MSSDEYGLCVNNNRIDGYRNMIMKCNFTRFRMMEVSTEIWCITLIDLITWFLQGLEYLEKH